MRKAIYSRFANFGVEVVSEATGPPVIPAGQSRRLPFIAGLLHFFLPNIKRLLNSEFPMNPSELVTIDVQAVGLNPVDAKFLYGDKVMSLMDTLPAVLDGM
jgi:hypothetical protein